MSNFIKTKCNEVMIVSWDTYFMNDKRAIIS